MGICFQSHLSPGLCEKCWTIELRGTIMQNHFSFWSIMNLYRVFKCGKIRPCLVSVSWLSVNELRKMLWSELPLLVTSQFDRYFNLPSISPRPRSSVGKGWSVLSGLGMRSCWTTSGCLAFVVFTDWSWRTADWWWLCEHAFTRSHVHSVWCWVFSCPGQELWCHCHTVVLLSVMVVGVATFRWLVNVTLAAEKVFDSDANTMLPLTKAVTS